MGLKKVKYTKINILIVILIYIVSYSCDEEENKAPVCSITYPANGAEYEKGETITISVDADDTDGNVTEVRFYINNSEIGSSSIYPYEWSTTAEDIGSNTIKAIAKDDNASSTSDEISINIVEATTGKVTDYDGNNYKTIKIGTQWWMAENLRTTHYANGTALVNGTSAGDIWGDDKKYYFAPNNEEKYVDTYGRLYTWHAAMNGAVSSSSNPSNVQGACPDGWHLPSDDEWKQLEMYLGMSQIDADSDGTYTGRGTNEGSKLAGDISCYSSTGCSFYWRDGALVNDVAFETTGFDAAPVGYRVYDGTISITIKSFVRFWSATEFNSTNAWIRGMGYGSPEVGRFDSDNHHGYAVRCVKD